MIENDCVETIRYTSAAFTSSLRTECDDRPKHRLWQRRIVSYHEVVRVAIKTVMLIYPFILKKPYRVAQIVFFTRDARKEKSCYDEHADP